MRKEYGNVNLIEARPGRDAPRSALLILGRAPTRLTGWPLSSCAARPMKRCSCERFEDARRVSPEWRPYLLACSVHALHGEKSADSTTLIKVRQALG